MFTPDTISFDNLLLHIECGGEQPLFFSVVKALRRMQNVLKSPVYHFRLTDGRLLGVPNKIFSLLLGRFVLLPTCSERVIAQTSQRCEARESTHRTQAGVPREVGAGRRTRCGAVSIGGPVVAVFITHALRAKYLARSAPQLQLATGPFSTVARSRGTRRAAERRALRNETTRAPSFARGARGDEAAVSRRGAGRSPGCTRHSFSLFGNSS